MLTKDMTLEVVSSFEEAITIETLVLQLIISTISALITSLMELQSLWSRTLNEAELAGNWLNLRTNSWNSKLATWSGLNFQLRT